MTDVVWMDLSNPDPQRPLNPVPPKGARALLGYVKPNVQTPATPTRGAVLAFPGGGYGMLSDHEGHETAAYLATRGFHAFVCWYRFGEQGRHPKPLRDAQRAVRVIRFGSANGWWDVDPTKIAGLGYSAGGHLAATLATEPPPVKPPASADQIDTQPFELNAVALAYPVIHLSQVDAHRGSRDNLLGPDAPWPAAAALDADARVGPHTPPAFLFHTAEDTAVPASNALAFALAMLKHNRPVDLHLFGPGRHGLGLALQEPALATWSDLMIAWLKRLGF